MRILHLVHQYPPDYVGGTELYTRTLAAIQAQAGHDVAVFCPSNEPDGGSLLTRDRDGVRVYRIAMGSRTRAQVFWGNFRQRQLLEDLKTILRQELPDIVHIQHLMGMPIGIVDLLAGANIPYIITLHDYWYVCANAQLLTNTDQTVCLGPDRSATNCGRCALARIERNGAMWTAPVIAPLMRYRNERLRKVLGRASYVIAPTDFVYQTYVNLGIENRNMVVIRHGIALPDETDRKTYPKHRSFEGESELRVGYIGGISKQKGVHILIDAVNKLPAKNIQLLIYGDLNAFPEYAAQLKAMIKRPEIFLAGSLPHGQLWTTLADLDLVVLPTLWYETSSLVLDEAFAAGVPVFASDIGVMADKVNDDVNGRLFPPGNATVLSQYLEEVATNPDLLGRWRQGIPPVRTIEDHMREIEELYQTTLDTV